MDYNMSLMLGFASGSIYQLSTENFFQHGLDKSYDDYLTTSLMSRLELRSAGNRIKAAEIGIKSAKNNLYPTLSAGTNYYNNQPNSRVFPSVAEFKGTWDARLTLSWNFSSLWTNKAKVNESKSLFLRKGRALL